MLLGPGSWLDAERGVEFEAETHAIAQQVGVTVDGGGSPGLEPDRLPEKPHRFGLRLAEVDPDIAEKLGPDLEVRSQLRPETSTPPPCLRLPDHFGERPISILCCNPCAQHGHRDANCGDNQSSLQNHRNALSDVEHGRPVSDFGYSDLAERLSETSTSPQS